MSDDDASFVREQYAAPDNLRARAVYERVGARGDDFVEYELELDGDAPAPAGGTPEPLS